MSNTIDHVASSTWTVDSAHTHAGFSVRHMMITTVRGSFAGVSGTLVLDEQDAAKSSVSLDIEAATIDTGMAARDEHLRSGDFFDVANHPAITFRSRSVEATGKAAYRVTGDLTIRGTTREVVVDVEEEGRGKDPWGGDRVGFTGSTKIDRTDWGLVWNQGLETGGVLVSNEVRISVELQVTRS